MDPQVIVGQRVNENPLPKNSQVITWGDAP